MPQTRRPLRATYRLQLHAEFPLAAARTIVPYLARLGISHVTLQVERDSICEAPCP